MTQIARLSAPGRAPCAASRRHPRIPLAAITLLALCSITLSAAGFAAVRSVPSVQQFYRAQALRSTLEAMPAASRTSADYERVLNAYRAVYHADPQSSKADDSIVAVAELLAEKGRVLHRARPLQQAIEQYEFLRKQYPYSPYRFSALLDEGSIYLNDLKDKERAKAAFLEFLQLYPSQPLATQARAQLRAIDENGRAETATAQSVPAPSSPPPSQPRAAILPPAQPASHAFTSGQAEHTVEGRSDAVVEPASLTIAKPEPPPTTQPASDPAPEKIAALKTLLRIRYWSTANSTRIAINLDGQVPYKYAHLSRPDRIYYDLENTSLARSVQNNTIPVSGSSFLQRIRTAQFSHNTTRIVLNVGPSTTSYAFYLPNPWRLIIDLHADSDADSHAAPAEPVNAAKAETPSNTSPAAREPAPAKAGPTPTDERLARKALMPSAASARAAMDTAARKPAPAVVPAHRAAAPVVKTAQAKHPAPVTAQRSSQTTFTARRAAPTSNGKPSLVRTLGLKINRIVIDPGHGGYDSGTLGPGGMEEKDVVLDVALRLGKLLEQQLGEQVIFTRTTDVFVPLEERTAIANRAHADLFISIHANSSSDKSVRGVECYYLNFTTDPDALKVAARENAVSNEQINQLSSLIKKIALSDKVEESREFALDVQKSLYDGLRSGNPGLKNRGVKRAPFVVLIGARMPSILAEISFLTNASDASEMRRPAYRERIAESLYGGIADYIRGLSGIRLAQYPENPDVALSRGSSQ